MANEAQPSINPHKPAIYQIRIKGHLGEQWADWFDGLSITPEAYGETCISGLVVDQAALHGLLKKVRDLGLPLISVSRVNSATDATPNIEA